MQFTKINSCTHYCCKTGSYLLHLVSDVIKISISQVLTSLCASGSCATLMKLILTTVYSRLCNFSM